jgi:hypothetical protein
MMADQVGKDRRTVRQRMCIKNGRMVQEIRSS